MGVGGKKLTAIRTRVMRILLVCMACVSGEQKDFEHTFAELQDSGLYAMECRQGHKNTILVQEQKFEMLFELGANAILDGYYREAVTSFASALERFYEFYIELICSIREIKLETFETAWKIVANMSERQFGAYLFLHIGENGKLPSLLPKRATELRNSVIHKGRIPSREEAIDFGQSVLDVIAPTLNLLKRTNPDAVHATVARYIARISTEVPSDILRTSMTIPTTISISRHSDMTQPNLIESLSRIAQMRSKLGMQ